MKLFRAVPWIGFVSNHGKPARQSVQSRLDIRDTYDQIGSHFAKTRPEPWPEISNFLEDQQGRVGLDVGVGNGRHAEILAQRCQLVLGLDLSRVVLSEASRRAQKHGFEITLVSGDAAALPFKNNSIDLAVYVATLHHIASRPSRIESLNELARVLISGGWAIISVWSIDHERFEADTGFDTSVAWTLPNGDVANRFYHIYDREEFKLEIKDSDLHQWKTFVSNGNCFAVVRPDH